MRQDETVPRRADHRAGMIEKVQIERARGPPILRIAAAAESLLSFEQALEQGLGLKAGLQSGRPVDIGGFGGIRPGRARPPAWARSPGKATPGALDRYRSQFYVM